MVNSPQLENGYTKISNELIEAFCTVNLSPYESRLLWCIIRKTYGYSKKQDWISQSQIQKITGIPKSHVSRAKKKLLNKNIVTQTGNLLSINKFYKTWKKLPKQVTKLPKQVTKKVTQTGNSGLPKQVIEGLPKQGYTKETITKETITKESNVANATSGDLQIARELMASLMNTNESYRAKYTKNSSAGFDKVKKWAEDIEKLRRIDNMPPEKISAMIEWLFKSDHKDAIFWRGNIQSGRKLREKFPQLLSAMERDFKKSQSDFLFIS